MSSDEFDFSWDDTDDTPAQTGLPNPNAVIQKPERRVQPQQQQLRGNMKTPPQQARPVQQGNRPVQQGVKPQQNRPVQPPQKSGKPKKKGKWIIPVVLILVSVLFGVVVLVKSKSGNNTDNTTEQQGDYASSGVSGYDALLSSINNYDATTIDSVVGYEDGDSYIAQEWAYANGVPLKEEFIIKVCSMVSFDYSGSMMNNGEPCKVTVPDYDAVAEMMENDRAYIDSMLVSSGYTFDDYDWTEKATKLMMQYFCDKGDIPTTVVEITLPVEGNRITSDAELDKVLFSSDAFHNMVRTFSQCLYGWTGFKTEVYTEKEEQHNPEYDEWFAIFIEYFTADGGIYDEATGKFSNVAQAFDRHSSKWEPWYVRDENNVIQRDENGEPIVNYFSVKDENGNDWIQPDEIIVVSVEKERQVEDPWVEETGIPYSSIGTWYIQNEYTGKGDTSFRIGDGSLERPAGVGTSIITKVLCSDGKYHDVLVTLRGYWTGQDAIDYVELFDSRNKGFSASAVVQLITYEVEVKNLENAPITFDSEMSLGDDVGNMASRTGTVYSFTSSATLQPGESVILNDWATSTELEQKYVVWGKSFNRQYPLVYFQVLAGSGEVPPYSAYEQFDGTSRLKYRD